MLRVKLRGYMLHCVAALRFVVCPACVRLSGASNFTQSWSQDFAYQCMSTVGSLCVYFPPSIVSFNVQSPNIVLPQLLRSSILSERGELWVAPTGPARRQTLWSRALEQRPIVNYRTERGTHTRPSGRCWEDFQLSSLFHYRLYQCTQTQHPLWTILINRLLFFLFLATLSHPCIHRRRRLHRLLFIFFSLKICLSFYSPSYSRRQCLSLRNMVVSRWVSQN